MAVEIVSNTILKPSPSSLPNLLLNSHIPLTIFDLAAFDLHVKVLYAFRPPMPTNEVMIDALAKVLNHFPHLAGRLTLDDDQRRPTILLNNAGVRLVEAFVGTPLADQLPFLPSHELTHLHPPIQGVEELLQIQLNRFSCGGLVIGQTAHHRVADGESMSSFFLAWAKLVRGMDVDSLPYHDRAAIFIPRNPPMPEFDHGSIEFSRDDHAPLTPHPAMADKSSQSVVNLVVHFSPTFINRLKMHVSNNNNNPGYRFSTFECLLAHTWKKITLARGLGADEMTQVRVAVNGRGRMKPRVPMEYFGNLVLWAYPRLRVEELLNESYAFVAKAIHSAVACIDNAYFQSFIDFGDVTKGKEREKEREELVATAPAFGNSLCPNMEVDSWLRFEFHELDFGGGGPCAFLPTELPVEGLLVFVPSCEDKGGVDAFTALFPEHVDYFKQISHSLD